MSHADDLKAVFVADIGTGKMATLLTGGIYTYADTGRNGISRDSTPNAYSGTTGQLKPCCVIKQRGETPSGGINDEAAQLQSMKAIIEVWFYDNGNAALTVLAAAQARARVLTHAQRIGSSRAFLINKLDDLRDESLERAHIVRRDYEFNSIE